MSSSSAGLFHPGSIGRVSEAETCSEQTGREKRILLSSPYAIALGVKRFFGSGIETSYTAKSSPLLRGKCTQALVRSWATVLARSIALEGCHHHTHKG